MFFFLRRPPLVFLLGLIEPRDASRPTLSTSWFSPSHPPADPFVFPVFLMVVGWASLPAAKTLGSLSILSSPTYAFSSLRAPLVSRTQNQVLCYSLLFSKSLSPPTPPPSSAPPALGTLMFELLPVRLYGRSMDFPRFVTSRRLHPPFFPTPDVLLGAKSLFNFQGRPVPTSVDPSFRDFGVEGRKFVFLIAHFILPRIGRQPACDCMEVVPALSTSLLCIPPAVDFPRYF